VNAQNSACQFDARTLQFVGTPVEQARCLLRPNRIGGLLDAPLKRLPSPLEKLIGKQIGIKKAAFRKYLQNNKFDENSLGGSLDLNLSKAKLPNQEEVQALYFIIHDTSSPYLKDAPFPSEINEASYSENKLEQWLKQPVAHVFVNRVGESITINDFGETVKKGWGTKFARDKLKADAKGLQIHIELIQPRRRDPSRRLENNDAIAPFPGFTPEQYDRLALLYVAASIRRGNWLVPAYHSAIDAGIPDAHDDPQNFELKQWAKALENLLNKIEQVNSD
jgi:hypothetical protein